MIRVPLYRRLNPTQRVASFSAGSGISLSTSGSISAPDEIVLTITATGGGGGGGGAPTNASYLTLGTDATLTDERVFGHTTRMTHTDGGAGGSYTLDLNVSGVSAGTYTYASVTVDAYGRVTAASSGAAPVAPPSPASSVVTETSFGQSSATGTATSYAREDHTHGTPALPAHNTLSNLAWINAGHTGTTNAVAAWNEFGTPTVSQATTDETMLVRRGGVLQWVPLVASVVFFKGEIVDDGKILFPNGIDIFSGSIV